MRKLLMSLIMFCGSAAAVLLVFFMFNDYSPTMQTGSSLPADIAETPYILTGAVRDTKTMLAEYSLPCPSGVPELSIVIAASYPFTVSVGDEVIYRYTSSDPFHRVHVIELGHEEYFSTQNAVSFTNYSATLSTPILLIGGNSAVVKQAAHSYGIQMFSLGAQTLILFYSIYLFYRKRSERYLLLLLLITIVSITISVISLSYPLLDITDAQYRLIQGPLNMIIRAVVILMCVKLTNIDLPDKLANLLKWHHFVPIIGFLLILNKTNIPALSDAGLLFMDQGYLIALAALLYAAYVGKRSCYPLLAGLGAMQGVYYYYRIVSTTEVVRGTPMVYFYVGQFGNLFFVLACMMVATARLAANFQASESTARHGLTLLSDEQAARRGMMTNIFHDLRSPLFIMKGCLDQLEDVVPAGNKTISVMRERLDFQEQLISDLFLAARLEEGKLMITDNADQYYRTLCRETVETYRRRRTGRRRRALWQLCRGLYHRRRTVPGRAGAAKSHSKCTAPHPNPAAG